MPNKDLTGLLIAKISKKEIEQKHPEWLEQFGIVKFIKNEFKEELKDVLIEKIVKQAKEQNYYIYDEIIIRETPELFYALALAYPQFVPGHIKKLRPPKYSPEEIREIFKKKIEEANIIGYGGKETYYEPNQ